jgi:hypothetical protein
MVSYGNNYRKPKGIRGMSSNPLKLIIVKLDVDFTYKINF